MAREGAGEGRGQRDREGKRGREGEEGGSAREGDGMEEDRGRESENLKGGVTVMEKWGEGAEEGNARGDGMEKKG